MVTLKEIAKLSGVSTATVSYVLNGGPRSVLPATRERVLNVIAETNYRPNAAARGLRGKRTHTFGVVFPHLVEEPFDNVYFGPILAGIVDAANERHQLTMLFTGMSWEEAQKNVSLFCDGRCDGFIFVAPPPNAPLVTSLLRHSTKLVLVGTQAPGLPVCTVDCENVEGARLATLHLLDKGHTRIGFIKGNAESTSAPERTEGFFLAMKERGVEVDPLLIVPSHYQDDAAYASARQLLERPADQRPTAIFTCQDLIARMVMKVAHELRISVPEDLSLVGFDDIAFAGNMIPPLTTIRQPLRQIGATAASTLFDFIEDDQYVPSSRRFDVQLVERSSCAAPGAHLVGV